MYISNEGNKAAVESCQSYSYSSHEDPTSDEHQTGGHRKRIRLTIKRDVNRGTWFIVRPVSPIGYPTITPDQCFETPVLSPEKTTVDPDLKEFAPCVDIKEDVKNEDKPTSNLNESAEKADTVLSDSDEPQATPPFPIVVDDLTTTEQEIEDEPGVPDDLIFID